MGVVRRQLQEARTTGDEEGVLVARMLYREASNLQYDLIQIEISEVLQTEEVVDLREALKSAKDELAASLDAIKDSAHSVAAVAKALGQLGKILTRIGALG